MQTHMGSTPFKCELCGKGYRTRGISNTVTNMMSEIFAGVSNRVVLQIGWCFK